MNAVLCRRFRRSRRSRRSRFHRLGLDVCRRCLHPGMKSFLVPLSEVVQFRGLLSDFLHSHFSKVSNVATLLPDSGQSLLQPCPENFWLFRWVLQSCRGLHKSLGPQPSSMSGFKPAPPGLITNCCFERTPFCSFLVRDCQGRCTRTRVHFPFIRPCAARGISQGSLGCSPLRRPDRMLLYSCMCRTEASRIVARLCHDTLALVEQRADGFSPPGARFQPEVVILFVFVLLLAFFLHVLDLRRDLYLGRDERPVMFVATDALWMPVHKKALWLRWYITACVNFCHDSDVSTIPSALAHGRLG